MGDRRVSPLSHWNSVRAYTVALVLVATCVFALWWRLASGPVPRRPHPALEVNPDTLDFGEVIETSRFLRELPLTNVSANPLRVRLDKHCDCAGVEPETLDLAPGDTRKVTVRLDLLHNRLRFAGRRVRPYQAHLTAYYGDRAGDQLPVTLTGKVRAILDTWPPNLHLKDELVEGEDSAEEIVTVKPVTPLAWLVVKYGPPPIYVNVKVESAKDGYLLWVRVKAGLPRGWFSHNVELQMADAKGAALPEQFLQVTGTVTGRFVCVPAETTFGIQPIG